MGKNKQGKWIKIYTWLHNKLHKNNPPYVPIDTNAYLCQSIVMGSLVVFCAVNVFITSIFLDASPEDRLVAKWMAPCVAIWYFATDGSTSNCGFRAMGAYAGIAGKFKQKPQEWNGLYMER